MRRSARRRRPAATAAAATHKFPDASDEPARYSADMKSRAWLRHLLAQSLTPLLASALAAQATLTVGPGGYAEIADAVAAAQPGDLIVVQSGIYLPFDVPIGVRIVAPGGATITTPPGGPGLPFVHDVQPPAGQQATIVGLTFQTNPVYPPAEPPVTVRARGNVVFADCHFRNTSDYGSNSVICDGDVQFDRCGWTGFRDCLSVIGGRVVANECTFLPVRVNWADAEPTCIVASSGDVRLNFCDLHGSDGGVNTYLGAPAIRLTGDAHLSIADSTITGGNSQYWASMAIDNNSPNPVLHARSTIHGGNGLLLMNPPVSGPGPAFNGPAQVASLIGGIAIPGGPRIGASYYGSVLVPPNSIIAMVLSFERTAAITVPFAALPLHFDPASAIVYSWGLPNQYTPWPGTGAYLWQTPTLTQAMFGDQFWLHALVWDGTTFQVGPTFGGLVH